MTQPVVKPKFKVGQLVKLRSLDALLEIGERQEIEVNENFRYSNKSLTIELLIFNERGESLYKFSNYKELSSNNWWYPEDFLQSVRQLPDHLKGKL